MEIYITINRTKWYCSKLLIKLVITRKTFLHSLCYLSELLWNDLWSVSRYVMGPLSGRWRQSGNDQQCLTAPIWKYRSGFGDHRFTFFIDLRPNYTFYTNLTNIVHWVVAYRDVAHLVRLNLGKSWEKSAKSFDAGLISQPSPRGQWVLRIATLAIGWLIALLPVNLYRRI